jgi:thioredoxin-like negative regulator of GroEL
MSKYEKGHPGGPGRPPGSRNAVNVLLDQLAADGAETMVKAMIGAAAEGNHAAARLVLNRIWSAPRDRPAKIALPEIHTAADLVTAHSAIVKAIAAQEITPRDGAAVAAVLETHGRAFELLEQEKRVEALEVEVRRLRSRLT